MTSTTRIRRQAVTEQSPSGRRAGAAVQATDLVKVYGKGGAAVRAVDGITVTFGAGEFSAIMGPSGSGKSTLMHCLAGLDTVTAGEVWLGHLNLSGMSDADLTRMRREKVGFIFQSFNLLGMLTTKQNVLLPFELAGKEPDWRWFDSVVEVLGLTDRLRHRPSELSGGEQQRVAVARALVTRPEVVFADEPTGNLDSRTGAEVLGFLRTSVRELGQSVVMVTHDPDAASYADRVVLLADGKVAGEVLAPTRTSVLDALRVMGD